MKIILKDVRAMNGGSQSVRSQRKTTVEDGELRSPKKGVEIKKLRLIGKGGSGTEVWCVKRSDGWTCCAKIIRYSKSMIQDVENFERELEILKSLPEKTKNIVQYLGFERTEKEIQVFISLYEGNLFDKIKERKGVLFNHQEILPIVHSVLSALVFLHSQKLIHRDVKSANVFYETDYNGHATYVLGDFGESKILLRKSADTIAGTNRWIAPEVFKSSYSFEADVWSFGMLLYELITLEIPFHEFGLGVENEIISGRLPNMKPEHAQNNAFLLVLYENCVTFDPAKRVTASEALRSVQTLMESQ